MFQSSFNWESSLKFFSTEFSVDFPFSCLTWYNFSCRLSFNFTFFFWGGEAFCRLFKKGMKKKKNPCVASFFCLQFGPRICTEASIVVLGQKREVAFWCRIVWHFFSLSTLAKSSSARGRLDFFFYLEVNF